MATISEHISKIRTIIKQYSDDSIFSDAVIYSYMNDARALLLKRELDKKSFTGSGSELVICARMEEDNFYDCDCVPDDECKIMKSVCEIPDVISTKSRSMIRVYDGSRRLIEYVHMSKLRGRSQSDDTSPYWTWVNNRIALFGKKYKVIFIQGIFNNPIEVEDFCDCDEEDTGPCVDLSSEDFPIEPHLARPMRNMVLEEIFTSFRIKDDETNNANGER